MQCKKKKVREKIEYRPPNKKVTNATIIHFMALIQTKVVKYVEKYDLVI